MRSSLRCLNSSPVGNLSFWGFVTQPKRNETARGQTRNVWNGLRLVGLIEAAGYSVYNLAPIMVRIDTTPPQQTW